MSSDNNPAHLVHKSVKHKLGTDQRMQALIDAIPGLVTVADSKGRILAVSEMMAKLSGFKKTEALGSSVMNMPPKLLPSRSRAVMKKKLTQYAAKGRTTPFEIDAFDRRGRKMTLEVNTSRIQFSGKPGFLTVFRDITSSREAEKRLTESEQRYRSIVGNMRDAVMLTEPDGRISYLSPASRSVLGHDPEDLIGKQLWAIHSEDLERVKRLHNMALKGKLGLDAEYRIKTKAGKTKWVAHSWSPLLIEGKLKLIVSILKDMTNSKQAHESLAKSEERYKSLFETSRDAISVTTPSGEFLDVNQAWLNLFGYSRDEIPRLSAKKAYADPSERETFRRMVEEKGYVSGYEAKLRRKNGTVMDCLVSSSLWRTKDGENLYQTIVRDISERRRMEEALRESEENLRSFINSMRDTAYVVDANGNIVLANQLTAKRLRKAADELVGSCIFNLIPSDVVEHRKAAFSQVFSCGKPLTFESRREEEYFDYRLYPIFDAKGIVAKLAVLGVNITEHKRAEKVLRESEMRYRSLFENSRDAITINRPDGQFIEVNQSWLDLLGYSREETARLKAQDVYADPVDRNKFRHEIERRGFVKDYEIRVRKKDGTELDCLLTSVPWRASDGKIIGYQGILRDTTARKKIEEELRDSEKRFRKILESSPIPTMITSLEGPILDVNNAWVQMSGYSREEAIGKSTIDLSMLLDPEERGKIVKTLLEKKRLSNIEISRRTKSGELRSLLNTLELVDLSGQSCILNMQVDITDRKRAEEKLRQHSERLEEMIKERTRKLKSSEEKYRRIYETSANAIYTTSVDGTILDINPAGVSMFGFDTLDELRKMNVIELYADPSDRKKLIELVRHGPVKGHEIQLKRKDGRVFDAFLNAHALTDENGKITGLQGAIMDITERRELERMRDQLTSTILLDVTRRRELEKIRDQFISVVTHELRTPLTSIKGYVDDVLTGEVGQMSEQVASSLLVVKRNADRLLDLVNELLEIRRLESGRFQLDLTLFDFQQVVNHCAQEIKPLIGEKGQIFRIETPERPVTIQGDRARLIQVLMNLLNNANKFTPEGGNIVLRVEERGESIRIQVSDTGIGVRKEDLERVFEPFAAIQKPTYVKGTGLGLSVTKGLVEAHRGKIWAESLGEGKGTTFIVVLPKEEAVKSD